MISKLYQDYNIKYASEGKHCREGWVNIPCPFCTGNPGDHLGVPDEGGMFHCWRCGKHHPSKVISTLLKITETEARKLLISYTGTKLKQAPTAKINLKPFKYPTNTKELGRAHKNYLEQRGFDSIQLQRDWGLLGTGNISLLEGIKYNKRVLAPVTWNNEVVTFQGRDITENHPMKYLACPKKRETIHHKHILYGRQDKWGEVGICVEGITDVWRFGFDSFCTFGIKYTPTQVREIKKHFKRVIVVFDADPQAIEQANKLVAELNFMGVSAHSINIENDPGSMSQEEADYFVKQLLK